jgi:hypothetical protein
MRRIDFAHAANANHTDADFAHAASLLRTGIARSL